MVLQRWQTVYLLISVIAMALAAAFPAVEPLRVAQPVVELGGAVLAVVEPRFTMTAPLPVLALACTLMAKSRIQKDYKIIHDCDRLR